MIVVLDTNVLVSGLLNSFGSPGRIVDLVIAGSLRLAFDDRVLAEYRAVLARPRFKLDAAAVADLLEFLEERGARVLAGPLPGPFPDDADAKFLEVAAAAAAEALVTGNSRHFPAEVCRGIAVVTPAVFLASLTSAAPGSPSRG